MILAIPHTKKDREALPLQINLVGLDYPQEPVIRSDNFPLFQWFYCVRGQGEFIIRGQKSILSPGQIALLHPYEPHSYRALSDDWRVHLIGFSGSCCLDVLKTLRIDKPGVYHLRSSGLCLEYLERIHAAAARLRRDSGGRGRRNPDRKKVLLELSKLCYGFLLEVSSSLEFIGMTFPGSGNETVAAITMYLETHYSEPVTLSDLAEETHLSKGYICSIFRREMGQTVTQYLSAVRIAQARIRLIETPELKVCEIGKACGFETASYFGKIFRKITKMTPEEYRHSQGILIRDRDRANRQDNR